MAELFTGVLVGIVSLIGAPLTIAAILAALFLWIASGIAHWREDRLQAAIAKERKQRRDANMRRYKAKLSYTVECEFNVEAESAEAARLIAEEEALYEFHIPDRAVVDFDVISVEADQSPSPDPIPMTAAAGMPSR